MDSCAAYGFKLLNDFLNKYITKQYIYYIKKILNPRQQISDKLLALYLVVVGLEKVDD